MTKEAFLRDLRTIPGVGKNIAEDLYDIGIRSVAELRSADPQNLYDRCCAHAGTEIDRCLLYVFRSAVYFASHKAHDPEKLLWWNWKDR